MDAQKTKRTVRPCDYNLHASLTLREVQALNLHAERQQKKKVDLVRDWIRTLPEYLQIVEGLNNK
jgi:hypothetical protein